MSLRGSPWRNLHNLKLHRVRVQSVLRVGAQAGSRAFIWASLMPQRIWMSTIRRFVV